MFLKNLQRVLILKGILYCAFCLQLEATAVVRTFHYNPEGKLKEITAENNYSVTYEYDALQRIKTVTDSHGKAFEYDYDENNNPIELKDENGTTKYRYNFANKLEFAVFPGFAPVQYAYDVRGRLKSIQYPGGIDVLYFYDNADRLTLVFSRFGTTHYTYNHTTNTLDRIVLPNGVTTDYGYDDAKRVTSVFHRRRDKTLILGYTYILDGNGNRRETKETTPQGTKTTLYSYDKLNRLTSITSPEGYEIFTYDALGNRKTKETPVGKLIYEYDENNLLKKIGDIEFSYDSRGNLIQKSSPTQTSTYTYDDHDNLITYENAQFKVVYSYDGAGRRISKTVNGEKVFYINDIRSPTTQVLLEMSEEKNPLALYIYGMSRLAQITPNSSQQYLYDYPDRNVIGLVDEKQALCTRYEYEPFGSLENSTGNIPNHFLFAGEAFEKESGLIYLRNRYYDPEIGRFISADPKWGDPLNPQSFNPYVYAGNNPINFIDPLGLRSALFCAYPPGTKTPHGKSALGHGFWILIKDNGEVITVGRYADGVHYDDSIVPGTVVVHFPATDHQIDRMVARIHNGAYILGIVGNCIDGLECGLEILGVEHPSFNVLGVSTPSKAVLWAESMNGKDDYKRAMQQDMKFIADPDIFSPAPRPNPTISLPSPLYGTSSSGDFGGVSLDKTAQLIGSFTDIVGATYDDSTGQLILVGNQNCTLPPMEFDDFAVAVKSVYGLGEKLPQDPGVSIDWNPQNNKKVEKNKLESLLPMPVRYEGATEQTHFGQVMFNADRLLKCLTLGKDNISGKQINPKVPGYLSLQKRYCDPHLDVKPDLVNRMWFVPKEITLSKAQDGKSFIFDTVQMEVLTESKKNNKQKGNEAAEAFAQHFTAHYDQFAEQYPILEELKRLGKITAVVKWIKENNIPLDLSLFSTYAPHAVSTPKTTPATAAAYVRPGLLTYWIIGGVYYHLSDSNFHEVVGSLPEQLQEMALSLRPSEDTFEWSLDNSMGDGLKAVAQTVEKTRKIGNVQRTFTDMQFAVPGEFPLRLVRYYNSFNERVSGFGQGWELVPARLTFPRKRVSIQWEENKTVKDVFPLIIVFDEGKEFPYSLQGLNSQGVPIYRTADMAASLFELEDRTFVLSKDANAWIFANDGRLLKQTDRDNFNVHYGYEEGQLKTISHSCGKQIQLAYKNGRIVQAIGPGEKTILYGYDANNQLFSIEDRIGILAYYNYDSDNNLSEICDAKKRLVFSAAYDDYHRATKLSHGKLSLTKHFSLKDHTQRIEGENGLEILNEYDPDYRLLMATNSLGHNLEVTYEDGILQPSLIKNSFGHQLTYGYDTRGNLNSVKNHTGIELRYWYDSSNRLVASLDGRKRAILYVYDEQGKLKRIFPHAALLAEDPAADLATFSYQPDEMVDYTFDKKTGAVETIKKGNTLAYTLGYNTEGLLEKVIDPYGYQICRHYDERSRLAKVEDIQGGFEYKYNDRDQVIKILSPIGSVQYDYYDFGSLKWIQDANGNETILKYDDDYNLAEVIDAEGGITRYAYNDTHRLKHITLPNGSIKEITYDELNRPKQEIIGE